MSNKLVKLEKFCFKIGILKKNNAAINNDNPLISLGAYGQLLMTQIRSEWQRANLNKFNNSFLVENVNLLEKSNQFDFNYFVDSLTQFNGAKLFPIGLINVHAGGKESSKPLFASSSLPTPQIVHLNGLHFRDDTNESASVSWERERRTWWSKLFNSPENIQATHVKEETRCNSLTSIGYELDEKREVYELETVRGIRREDLEFNELFAQLGPSALQANTRQVIITQTNSQSILHSILYDAYQTRVAKSDKIVLRIDYRLAPYKACILFEWDGNERALKSGHKQRDENKELSQISIDNLSSFALDLRRMLYMHQINTFVAELKSESDLEAKYDQLDELGVPYCILVPTTVAKDGICWLRNRDTTLSEQIHVSQLVKQFSMINSALSF